MGWRHWGIRIAGVLGGDKRLRECLADKRYWPTLHTPNPARGLPLRQGTKLHQVRRPGIAGTSARWNGSQRDCLCG